MYSDGNEGHTCEHCYAMLDRGFGNNLKGNNLLTTAKMKTHVFLNALQHGRLMLHVPAMKKGHLVRERMHTSVDLSQKKT
jgi:hypothetical protein